MKKISFVVLIVLLVSSLFVARDLKQQLEVSEERLENKSEELNKCREEVNQLESKVEELNIENGDLNSRVKDLKSQIENHTCPKPVAKKTSSKKLLGTFEATAYDDSPESQGQWVGKTATGMKPQRGVVAVDPNVIPLGTKLYVEGYGDAVAGDTGGAIKGNRIDLFMDTRDECYSFGRQNVKVYLQ